MMRVRGVLLNGLVVLLLTLPAAFADDPDPAKPRQWTDQTGKFKVSAQFVEITGDKVRLKKENGNFVDVPIAKLSAADQEIAKAFAQRMAAAEEENPFAKEVTPAPTVQEVSNQVGKSVAYISTRDQFAREVGLGSGFVIDTAGLVATNYHVIASASAATVKFRDGKELKVLGYRALDKKNDLAILEVETLPADAKALALTSAAKLKQGDPVLAIGHPAGFDFTVSNGILSAIRKTTEMPERIRPYLKAEPESTWLQITAPVAPGSSGGPLLSANGDLLGINSWIVPGQGVGFALHVQHLAGLAKRLKPTAQPLPVPGSFQGPAVTETAVVDLLGQFVEDFQQYQLRVASVADSEKSSLIAKQENPVGVYLPKLKALAEKHAGTRLGYESLVSMLRLAPSDDSAATRQAIAWCVGQLAERHLQPEYLRGLSLELAKATVPEAHSLLKTIVEQAPDRDTKGLACFALAASITRSSKARGRGEEDAIAALERIGTEFADLEFGETTLGEYSQPYLKLIKHLSAGRPAQEIVGKDSKDQEFKLTDFRGKVVLLDFWADWCPYCREMYAQERILLQKLSGKPFAILGVNCDTPERLKQVESGTSVTWRSWADGQQGPIAKAWNVEGYPTVYLIDHHGKIRDRNGLRGPALDAAVELAVQEAELGLSLDLIAPCSIWTGWDKTEAPADDWYKPEFNDEQWDSGRGPFGYGLGGESSIVEFGENPEQKRMTAYFRHRFEVKDTAGIEKAILGISIDDGAALFLNGKEVVRLNLKKDAKHGDGAEGKAKDDGLTRHYFEIDGKLLRQGTNVLAAQVHQSDPQSSDMRFDVTLSRTGKMP